MTTETSQRLHEFLAVRRVSTGICRRQDPGFRFRPDEFRNSVHLSGTAFVPIDAGSIPAVVRVVPETRHTRFRLESLWIGQPFSNPVLGQLSGDRRQIRADLSNAFVSWNLVATETSVNANQVA